MSEVLSHYSHAPVLVLPSPYVESLMHKNHLSFTELLKPFGQPPLLSSAMHTRTPNRGQYQLVRWGVRFVAAHEMETMEARPAERYLEHLLHRQESLIPKSRHPENLRESADVMAFNKQNPDPLPWYTRYRHEFLNTLRYNDAELLDQPLAMLVVLSGAEQQPVQWIDATKSNRIMPTGIQRGVYDAQILRAIAVVHDKHLEASDPGARSKAIEMIRMLQSKYTDVISTLIEINSLPLDTPNPSQRDLWSAFVVQGRAMQFLAANKPVVAAMNATSTGSVGGGGLDGDAGMNGEVKEYMGEGDDRYSGGDDGWHHLPLSLLDVPSSSSTAANATPDDWKQTQHSTHTASTNNTAVATTTTTTIATQNANDPFSAFLSTVLNTPPSEARGQYLSPWDVDALTAFTFTFITSHLLPSLEQRFLSLSTQVNQVRSSFNRLKAGWKSMMGGGRSNTNTQYGWVPQINTYHLQSMESQARQLADLSYVLQDYESAESNYTYCIRDYRNDIKQYKNYMHLATANEMLAYSLTYIDPTRYHDTIKDHIHTARSIYASLQHTRHAARVAILAAEAYRIKSPAFDRYKESLLITIRASKKEYSGTSPQAYKSIRAALLLEYAAYLFLTPPVSTVPPYIRKYAIALVLAGKLYGAMGFPIYEVRCDQCAAVLYSNHGWAAIDTHLNDKIGKELYQLHQYQPALQFFLQLITATSNTNNATASNAATSAALSSASQLQDLLYVVQRWYTLLGERKELVGLALPTFHDNTVIVSNNDPQTLPSCYTTQLWNAASRTQRMSLNMELCNKPLFTANPAQYKEQDRVCVVREKITVEVKMSNPLLLPLSITQLKLRVKHTQSQTQVVTTTGVITTHMLPITLSAAEAQQQYPADTAFVLHSQEMPLLPGASVVVQLSLLPLLEGHVLVEGVSWCVNEILLGYHAFALPLRSVPTRRGTPQLQPDPSLSIPILPPAPLLQVQFSYFPPQCYHGEFVQTVCTLKNVGAIGLHKLGVKVSHPGFIILGQNKAGNTLLSPTYTSTAGSTTTTAHLPNSISTPALSLYHHPSPVYTQSGSHTPVPGATADDASALCYPYNWSDVMIHLHTSLLPHESVQIPVWIRAAVEGKHDISFLFRYDPMPSTIPTPTPTTTASHALKFRLCHVSFPLHVTPLFSVKVFNKPSFADVHDSLLGLEIQDRQHETAELTPMQIQITRVNMVSKTWMIAAVGTHPEVVDASRASSGSASAHSTHLHSAHSSPKQHQLTISRGAVRSTSHQNLSTSLLLPNAALTTGKAAVLPSAGSHAGVAASTAIPVITHTQCHAMMNPTEALLLLFRITNLPALSLPTPMEQAAAPTQQSTVILHPPTSNPATIAITPPTITTTGTTTATATAAIPWCLSPTADCARSPYSNLLGLEKALMVEEERQALIINPAATIAEVGAPQKMDLIIAWTTIDIAHAPPPAQPSPQQTLQRHSPLHAATLLPPPALLQQQQQQSQQQQKYQSSQQQQVRFGFFHLPGLNTMKVLPSACPLKVHLSYPHTVVHDFHSYPHASSLIPTPFPIVSLPITIHIRNILEDTPISFLFECLSADEEFDVVRRQFRTLHSSTLTNRYLWHGTTRAKIVALDRQACCVLRVCADFYHPGEYNLNRFRFTVEVGQGKKPRVFFFPLQHLLRVEQQVSKEQGSVFSVQGSGSHGSNAQNAEYMREVTDRTES